MNLFILLALVAGVIVVLGYARRRRSGRDPLGPPMVGEMPDTRVAVVVGALAWYFLHGVETIAREHTDLSRLGGVAGAAATYTGVNLLVSFALLRWAPRGTGRPTLSAGKLVLAGVLGGLCVFAAQGALGKAIEVISAALDRPMPQQDLVLLARRADGADVTVLAICAIVIAPFAEEVFFRGILFPAAARVSTTRTGLLVQAVAFGAIHCANDWTLWPLAIPLAVVGWVAGWLYLRTASLAVPIVLHMTFNAINFAALRSGTP